MSFKTFKTSVLIALLSALMVACSSTSTEDTTGADDGLSGSDVATGTVSDSDTWGEGSPLSAGGVDTVFYFEFDKALLKPEARAALNIHAERLRTAPRNIRLEGHADERGTREYNMALGERRANSVKEYLTLQGVDPSYIEVISYGEERPAQLGSDESAHSMNRRVEMK